MPQKSHGDSQPHNEHYTLYRNWCAMHNRCYRSTFKQFKDYGGKGVRVCPEWHEYENFKEWALANGFVIGLSIDRLDSSADYTPENCHYITRSENSREAALRNKLGGYLGSKSGKKGILWRADRARWRVIIDGKSKGSFKTIEEAEARLDESLRV